MARPWYTEATTGDQAAVALRVGLLVCDHVDAPFLGVAGDYPDMFRGLLAGHPGVELVEYDLTAGRFPESLDECDGWVTTGSRRSVYEDEEWIAELANLVRRVAREGRPFVGVCFGHQMIAHALGGKVTRSESGWGIGIKVVEMVGREPWMSGDVQSYAVLNSHADQIEDPPPGARVLGRNEHCPISLMQVGATLLGIQGHPEFVPSYGRALMEARRGRIIPPDVVEEGLASLDRGPDRALLAGWIVSFLAANEARPHA